MRRPLNPPAPAARRGIVLIVVLFLLTLLAILGVTFVLYSAREAAAARLSLEAESRHTPDVEPELLLAYFLGQLLYDVDDRSGALSGLRGHSLARLLYGWNADDPQGNVTPWGGTGRLHEPIPFTVGDRVEEIDGYRLINYTLFLDRDGSPSDGFLRDPERLGWRTRLDEEPGPFTGGFNAPYTYPDLNNLFLAAVKADGTVLAPSYHRPWAGFGPLDPANPNWYDRSKPWLKYLVLRPRPADMGPGFPAPEKGGDVKNLLGGPGGNDSIWIDLGFPVLRVRDGRKYKPLFAPLILDLDGRVNVNVHGNVRGAGGAHASNQGWGPWEVNLGRVLRRGAEWRNLFTGSPAAPWLGRYGPDARPGSAGRQASFGPRPHAYAQADFDGAREPDGEATDQLQLPGPGAPLLRAFPAFPAGYGNGSGGRPGTERWEHPLLYDPSRPSGDDRAFALSELEALLRHGDTGSPALTSDLLRLCPQNFKDPRTRRLVTTSSFDLDRPGLVPWLFDRDDSGYGSPVGRPDRPPTGPPVPFPALGLRKTSPVPPNSDFRLPGAPPDEPAADWRAVADGPPGRIDLNRFLPPYPHQGRGVTPATYDREPLVPPDARFDAGGRAVTEQFLAAHAARQGLADALYRRLLAVTGVAEPLNPADPTATDLAPRRWLAQLAVNAVDFLDEDEVHTTFNFYTAADARDPHFHPGALNANHAELPRYWVFGTELPRVVLNEVLVEYQLPPRDQPGGLHVRVWAELFNPLPEGPVPESVQAQDSLGEPLYIPAAGDRPGYGPYRVVLANTNPNSGGPLLPRPSDNGNVLGTPDVARAETGDADFANVGTASRLLPRGFMLLGPPGVDARGALQPPPEVPWLRSPNLQYPVRFSPPGTLSPDDRPHGVTVVLRRLTNPHLPFDPRPTLPDGVPNPAYNPYITIDYLEGVPPRDATDPAALYTSHGKRQPYAADPGQVAAQPLTPGSPTGHTFGRPNQPVPESGRYDWLVHLDRPLISPMELLHVSGYPPHRLTHRFLSPDAPGGPVLPFNHLVPWFDQDNRLYRLFAFLRAGGGHPRAAPAGRVAGKVNLNTVWDPEILLALCDPQPGNHFTAADVYNPDRPDDPGTLFGRLLAGRTPGGVPGPEDRPFLSLAVGHSPGPGDSLYPAEAPAVFPDGSGIGDTLLRPAAPAGREGGGEGGEAPRLFEVSGLPHPYLRYEALTKLFNHVTTRSNVFAVWLTVGFFEVVDDSTQPPLLGAEVGRSEGRHIRHRMFAVVDRTRLALFATRSRTEVRVPPDRPAVEAAVTPAAMAGTGPTGRPWAIREGAVLTVGEGSGEETVVVTAVTPETFVARFTRSHPPGSPITARGNPGPGPCFRPAEHPHLVPYYSIID